jgi:hypothetical protein
MRSQFAVTAASLVTTVIVAGVAGVASVAWRPEAATHVDPSVPAAYVQEEDVEVVAPSEGLSVALGPSSHAVATDGDVVLEATLENQGTLPVVVSSDGVFDLFVQRTSSPLAMSSRDVSFLALCEVAQGKPMLLMPGESITRTISLSPEAPFDQPGRYTIGGRWHGLGSDVDIEPFELEVHEGLGVAVKSTRAIGTGA